MNGAFPSIFTWYEKIKVIFDSICVTHYKDKFDPIEALQKLPVANLLLALWGLELERRSGHRNRLTTLGPRNRASRLIKLQLVSMRCLDTTSQWASDQLSSLAPQELRSKGYWLVVSNHQRETNFNLMNLDALFRRPINLTFSFPKGPAKVLLCS